MREIGVRQIEAAVGQDVNLNAFQDSDSVELVVEAVDQVDLFRQPVGVEAVRAFDLKVLELTGVDDFDPRDLRRA